MGWRLLSVWLFAAVFVATPAAASDHELTVAFNRKAPFFYFEGDAAKGLVVDIVSRTLNAAGLHYHYEEMPFQRLLYNLQIQRPDFIVLGLSKTTEREKFAIFSRPIFRDQTPVVLFRHEDHDRMAAFATFNDLVHGGMLYGRKRGTVQTADPLLKNMQERELIFDAEVVSFPLLLLKRRFDFTILYPEEVAYAIAGSGIGENEMETRLFPDMPPGDYRYLLFSKALATETIERINASIPDVQP